MSQAMWIRSHLERLLQEDGHYCRNPPDLDGEYLVPTGSTAACWVGVVDVGDSQLVRAWAPAAKDMEVSAELFRELNEIQLGCASAAISLTADGLVVVSQSISPIGLTRPVLAQAMISVASVAEHIGLLLVAVYGGTNPFSPSDRPAR